MHLLLSPMTSLVHQNTSLLSSSLQSSVRLFPTFVLCHHPIKLFSLSSRYYYYKVAQKSISRNGILSLSHRTTCSMRNGMTGSSLDDEDQEVISLVLNRNRDKDNYTTGEYLLCFTSCLMMLMI